MSEFFREVLWHGVKDTFILFPVLFLTYLLSELAEHKCKEKTVNTIKRAGRLGPLFSGILGALPQCGFSAAAAGLYSTRLISVGTLVAVFLSTSDELIAVMLSASVTSGASIATLFKILALKVVCAVIVGFLFDLVFALVCKKRKTDTVSISDFCESEKCDCEKRGIVYAAFVHSLKIFAFIFLITVAINTVIFFIGEDNLAKIMRDVPIVGELVAGLFGLIPNCAPSVIITELYLESVIGASELLAGLFTACGVGMLVLFRTNRNIKENLTILVSLYVTGVLLGILLDVSGITALIGI